jgi:flagellar hook-associated protein 3 FlgL
MSAIAMVTGGRVDAESILRVSRLQRDAMMTQGEMASGRIAVDEVDRAWSLPARLALESRIASLDSRSESNRTARASVDGTGLSLTALRDLVSAVRDTTIGTSTSTVPRLTIQQTAAAALGTLTDITSTTFGGVYVFGGTRTDRNPMGSDTGPSVRGGVAQLEVAFATAFGFGLDDPQVAGITAAEMTTYVDAQVAYGLLTSTWRSTWSQASETSTRVRVGPESTAETTVTADAVPIRQVTLGLALLATSSLDTLSDDTVGIVVDRARKLMNDGLTGLAGMEESLASSTKILADTIDQQLVERRSLASALSDIEGVDAAEVSVRASDQLRHLEVAYTILGRLARLSLLDQMR